MNSIINRYKKRKKIDNLSNILFLITIFLIISYYLYSWILLNNSKYYAEATIEKLKSNNIQYSFTARDNWNFSGSELITTKQHRYIKLNKNLLVQYNYFNPNQSQLYSYNIVEDLFLMLFVSLLIISFLIILIYPFITIEYTIYILLFLPTFVFTEFSDLYLNLFFLGIVPSVYYLCKRVRLQNDGVDSEATITEIVHYKENSHDWIKISYFFNSPEYPYPVYGFFKSSKNKYCLSVGEKIAIIYKKDNPEHHITRLK